MPFLSQDWRCPGENWVKTDEFGRKWENARVFRQRMFQTLNDNLTRRAYRQSINIENGKPIEDNILATIFIHQPCVPYKFITTREALNVTSLGDALHGLDLKTAIKDVRRFGYVSKILLILLGNKFPCLSGRLQMFIVELVREVCKEVSRTGNQKQVIRDLLDQLNETLLNHKYAHIGGDALWLNHTTSLKEMLNLLEKMANSSSASWTENLDSTQELGKPKVRLRGAHSASYSYSEDMLSSQLCSSIMVGNKSSSVFDNKALFQMLPAECLDQILSNLQTPSDLETAGLVSPILSSLVNDDLIWRKIVYQNFTDDQVQVVMSWGISEETVSTSNNSQQDFATLPRRSASYCGLGGSCSWKRVYKRLLAKYGTMHLYPSKIALCITCSSLFWPIIGHACLDETIGKSCGGEESLIKIESNYRVLSPEDFVNLFKI